MKINFLSPPSPISSKTSSGTTITSPAQVMDSTNAKRVGVLALSAVALLTLPAHAVVTMTSLNDIIPGSETVNTTIVTNGNFEDSSSGNTHTPVGWSRGGDMFYDGQPGGVNTPNTGTGSARMHIDNPTATPTGSYSQAISGLTVNTEYVLSAYIWHLGDGSHGGQAEIDLGDAGGEPELILSQASPDANDGYFFSGTFNTSTTSTAFTLRAFMVHPGVKTGWPNQPVSALWDNISITPANEFVAPSLIPEPGSAAMLGLGAMAIVLRRRR